MEKMLKEFERVLNRKVGSVKELELILTRIYNNKLEEVNENRAKAFEELGEPLRKLCAKYGVIIQIPGLYDWNVESIEGYDYSKVCEKLNAEDVKTAIKIISYKIQEYMDKHFCSNVYAFDKVCEELFKDEKPFLLDSDYEQPVIKIDYNPACIDNCKSKDWFIDYDRLDEISKNMVIGLWNEKNDNVDSIEDLCKLLKFEVQNIINITGYSAEQALDIVCRNKYSNSGEYPFHIQYNKYNIRRNLLQKLEDADIVIIITTACQIQILKTKYLLRHSEHSLKLFDKINNLSNIKAIYGVFKVYGEKGGSHENIECIFGEDNLIGYANDDSINLLFDILQ